MSGVGARRDRVAQAAGHEVLRARQRELETSPWRGAVRRYDILREGTIAIVVVGILVVGLASVLGSPDDPALTFRGWAQAMPNDFYATTVSELAGTSESAGYGPPYNHGGTGQALGPVDLQTLMGVTIPVDPAQDFVIAPLETQSEPAVTAAVATWTAASATQQQAWAGAYDTALAATGVDGDPAKVAAGDYGPVPALAAGLEQMALSGALDGVLAAPGQFYSTDTTKQVLFMGDGGYLDAAASANRLQGNQWGMMNETGAYPGQQWLAPFSFWYQLPIFNSDASSGLAASLTANADIDIMAIVVAFTLVVILMPFIPGLRDLPRALGVHQLVWRRYYAGRAVGPGVPGAGADIEGPR